MLLTRTCTIATKSYRFITSFARIPQSSARHEKIKSLIYDNVTDWNSIKEQTMKVEDTYSTINEKNFDNLLLRIMVAEKKFEIAQTYVDYLKGKGELSLAVINGVLLLYTEMGKENKLTEAHRQVILDNYKHLYEKYKVLDSMTCEILLQALCIIDDWEKALKVLENIFLTNKPSHLAFSTLIGTLFRVNKKREAMELIEKSLATDRSLGYVAYSEWIDFIFRKYKTKSTILKHLEEILSFINNNNVVIPQRFEEKLSNAYKSLNWNGDYVSIDKMSGQCSSCRTELRCLKLTEDEFKDLQSCVREKLIMGSDLLLKSTPQELKRFQDFVKGTAPYDYVLDGLNIAYSKGIPKDRLPMLNHAVDFFTKNNKKVLMIGRKHMLTWPKHQMQYLMEKACCFFTENISQDDPYIITAAILSGSHTDIVSRDLLRTHIFQLKDPRLRLLFQRWQWQHQWRVISRFGKILYQRPLKFTPCSQKIDGCWHIPYKSQEEESKEGRLNDGTPDLSHWLCLRPSDVR